MDSSTVDHSLISWIFDQSGIVITAVGLFLVWWKLILPRQDKLAADEKTETKDRESKLIEGLKTSIDGSIAKLAEQQEKHQKDLTNERRRANEKNEQHAARLFDNLDNIGRKLAQIDGDVIDLKGVVSHLDSRVTEIEKRKKVD